MENNQTQDDLLQYLNASIGSTPTLQANIPRQNETSGQGRSIYGEQIKIIEEQLKLFSLPSFSFFYSLLSEDNTKELLSVLSQIIYIRENDNRKRGEIISECAKVKQMNAGYQEEIGKLKQSIVNLKNQIEKNETNYQRDKKKYTDTILSLKKEKEHLISTNNALIGKENQYVNEIKKKAGLISTLNEQIKKLSDSQSNKSKAFSFSSPEMDMSYCLNCKDKVSINKTQKEIFYEDSMNNLNEKYKGIHNENEIMKKELVYLDAKIREIAVKKKENYFSMFKSTFGFEFVNENKIDLSIKSTNVDINSNFKSFIDNLKQTFIQMKEFSLKTDEMLLQASSQSKVLTSETGDNNEKKYYLNMINIYNYYIILSEQLKNILEKVLQNSVEPKEKEDMVERAIELAEIAKKNVELAIKENKNLEQEGKIKSGMRLDIRKEITAMKEINKDNVIKKESKINYDDLSKEIENFTELINNMNIFFDNKTTEIHSKKSKIASNNDTTLKMIF